MASSRVTLFSDSQPLGSEDIDNHGLWMPKEEKQVDVETGRVRRKAIFGDTEDESGDEESEDEEEMSEDDGMEHGSSDDDEAEEEEEEEEGAESSSCKYMTVRGRKRPKLEEQEEDSEADLPAFADSDDDLERSSGEEEEAEEADESSADGASTGEGDTGESSSVGGASGARPSAAHQWRHQPDAQNPSPVRKAALTTSDSGHCTAEEAFPSEDESAESELSSEEEDSDREVRGKPANPQQDRGQKLEWENLVDETSDIENLLKEEEDPKEESNSSVETSGALKWKEDLSRKAAEAFLRQQQAAPNLRKLIYGTGKEFWFRAQNGLGRVFSEKEKRPLT